MAQGTAPNAVPSQSAASEISTVFSRIGQTHTRAIRMIFASSPVPKETTFAALNRICVSSTRNGPFR